MGKNTNSKPVFGLNTVFCFVKTILSTLSSEICDFTGTTIGQVSFNGTRLRSNLYSEVSLKITDIQYVYDLA